MSKKSRHTIMKRIHVRQAIEETIMDSDFNTHVVNTTSWAWKEVIDGVIKYHSERPSMSEEYFHDVIEIATEIVGEDRLWERAAPYGDADEGHDVSFAVFIETIAHDLYHGLYA